MDIYEASQESCRTTMLKPAVVSINFSTFVEDLSRRRVANMHEDLKTMQLLMLMKTARV